MSSWVIALVIATTATNISEWLIHKYILHGLGKKKSSFFHYHLEHHARSRKSGYVDSEYEWKSWTPMLMKEIGILTTLVLSSAATFTVYPEFAVCMALNVILYYYVHKKAHLDPEWARRYTPWHWDHHMGRQDANWAVTFPWADWVMGTREKG